MLMLKILSGNSNLPNIQLPWEYLQLATKIRQESRKTQDQGSEQSVSNNWPVSSDMAGQEFRNKWRSTLWLFNMAMENCPFIDDLWWFTYQNLWFSIATLNNHRVNGKIIYKLMEGFLLPCLITREYIQILFRQCCWQYPFAQEAIIQPKSEFIIAVCQSLENNIHTGCFWVPCLSLKSQNSISMTRDSKSSNCGSTRKKMIFQACFPSSFILLLPLDFCPWNGFSPLPFPCFCPHFQP